MAKITQSANARLPLSLEIRPWVKAAADPHVAFSLPDQGFTMADTLYWIDVTCSVGDTALFYTRNLLQTSFGEFSAADFEPMFAGESEGWGIGDMYPDTSLSITRRTYEQSVWYMLEIDLNVSRVFGATGDAGRTIFKIDADEVQLRTFAQDLEREFTAARSGVTPDPAGVPDGYGTLPFARRINARAYDVISAEYGDRLFDDEIYLNAFEDWVARLPPGGRVLDVGCGHGAPVVATLLERGFQVTGIDVSNGMLARARAAYPAANFINQLPTELTQQDAFDGICSFFSLLHTDPIELRVALARMQRALKPGGYLLIGSLLSDVAARNGPLYPFKGQWVWGCEFSADEAQAALTERDRFTIVQRTEDVQVWRPASSEPAAEAEPAPIDLPLPDGFPPLPPAFSGQSPTQWFTILAQRHA